jgi:hypothetical protein
MICVKRVLAREVGGPRQVYLAACDRCGATAYHQSGASVCFSRDEACQLAAENGFSDHGDQLLCKQCADETSPTPQRP